MGRYDGEYYEEGPECTPEDHDFAMNGNCYKCRRDRSTLISRAVRILERLAPDKLRGAADADGS